MSMNRVTTASRVLGAFGVAAVMAMVGGVCFLMLKRER